MVGLLKQRLLWRFLALGVLTLCIHLRSSVNAPLASTKSAIPAPVQTQSPRVTAAVQLGAPLVISSPRIISWNGQDLEVGLDLINVSGKAIRAYAIKQGIEGVPAQSGVFLFTSLDLTNHAALEPGRSTTTFDVYQATSSNEDHVIFSVDYVEFSDGTRWGPDSANFAERSAGQRAAGYMLSKRLLKILNAGNVADVMRAIETGAASIEPLANRSDDWKEGFRQGYNSITSHLKRAQKNGSLSQVERELRKYAKRFERADKHATASGYTEENIVFLTRS
jgi:hypothetical protein